jgi:hypothetical protein
MAIVGTPIDNGDGSYSFQTDSGEPLVLRGDAAQRAFAASKGGDAGPVMPSQELKDAVAPGADMRTATLDTGGAPDTGAAMAGGASPWDQFWRGAQSKIDASVASARKPYLDPNDIKRAEEAKWGGGDVKGANPTEPAYGPPAPGAGGRGKPVFYQPPAGPAVDPNQMVKLGQSSSSSTSYVTPYSKEELAQQRKADERTLGAAREMTEATSERGRQESDERTRTIQDLQVSQMKQEQLEQERKQVMAARMAKLDQLSKEAAAEKIDPNHFWADKDSAYRFEASIFAGLGALGEGLGGGHNYALQNLNGEIERDMHAQEANLKNKRESIAAETNLLGQLRQEYGDQAAAQSAFRIAKLGVADEKLKEIAARNIPEEQKAQLSAFQAKIQENRLAEAQKLNRKQISSTTHTQYTNAAALAAMQGQGQAQSAAEARIKGPAENAIKAIDHLVENAGPNSGIQRNPDGSVHVAPKFVIWSKVPGTREYNAMQTLKDEGAAEFAKVLGGGAASEHSEEGQKDAVGTWSAEQLSMKLNQVLGTSRNWTQKQILHGRTQVAGASEEE